MSFNVHLTALVRPLDPARHADEIRTLKRCRSLQDLIALSQNNGGWISRHSTGKRLRLVKHGNGTFLVVEYDEGWTKRLSMELFPGARR